MIVEKCIPLNSKVIKSLLSGKRTQLRKMVYPIPYNDFQPCEFVNPKILGWISYLSSGAKTPHIFPHGNVGTTLWVKESYFEHSNRIYYEADDPKELGVVEWKPPTYMPKKFSRISLEITYVNAQRVQETQKSDLLAEGFNDLNEFRAYWEDLQKTRKRNVVYCWDSNPWTWIIGVKIV